MSGFDRIVASGTRNPSNVDSSGLKLDPSKGDPSKKLVG